MGTDGIIASSTERQALQGPRVMGLSSVWGAHARLPALVPSLPPWASLLARPWLHSYLEVPLLSTPSVSPGAQGTTQGASRITRQTPSQLCDDTVGSPSCQSLERPAVLLSCGSSGHTLSS